MRSINYSSRFSSFFSHYLATFQKYFDSLSSSTILSLLTYAGITFLIFLSFKIFFFFTAEGVFDQGEIEMLVGLVNAILFSIELQLSGIIFFISLIAYFEKHPEILDIEIHYKKIMIFFVSMKILTLVVFLPIPNSVLNILILILILAFPTKQKKDDINPIFWYFVTAIIAHEFLLMSLELFDLGLVAQVRNNIPASFHNIQQTLFNLNSILDPFIVFYVVSKYDWELKDFEFFFKILLFFTTILALEFLLISFLIIAGSGVSLDSAFNLLMFNSSLVGSYHIVGRLGLVGLFFSIFLYSKYGLIRHVLFSFMMFGLMFSTLNRQVVLSGLLCLGLLFLIRLIISKQSGLIKFFKLMPILVIAILVPILANMQVQNIRGDDAQSILMGLQKRSLKYAKAADVSVNIFPLGSGVGLQQFFSGSRLIPTNLSDSLGYSYELDLWEVDRLTVGQSDDSERLDQQRGFSVHNAYLEVIVELGLIGFLVVIYFITYMIKHFFYILSMKKNGVNSTHLFQMLSVFMMTASIMISIMATSKFNEFWIIALAIGFLVSLEKSLRDIYLEKKE